jgi:hypothetical protein
MTRARAGRVLATSASTSDPDRVDPGRSDPGSVPAGTTTLEREEQVTEDDGDDHERFSHYVRKDKILKSALGGNAVVALCGKVWVPGRDPKKYPVCPECKKIFDEMQGGGSGEGSGASRGGGFFDRFRGGSGGS